MLPIAQAPWASVGRIAEFLEPGKRYIYRRKIVAFETSIAFKSHWDPEAGDYHVLTERILDTSWTADSLCP